jgi:hypothetical protein
MNSRAAFPDWYRTRLGQHSVFVQGVLWFLYGFIWIPLWYICTRDRASSSNSATDGTPIAPVVPTWSYFVWAAIGAVLGWSVGEAQARPFVPRMGTGFLMAFRLTGAISGVLFLPIARLACHRMGIEGKHFRQIGYWKVVLVALIGMGLGSSLGLMLGASLGAGFASMTPSMVLAFVGLIVPAMAWARQKAKNHESRF